MLPFQRRLNFCFIANIWPDAKIWLRHKLLEIPPPSFGIAKLAHENQRVPAHAKLPFKALAEAADSLAGNFLNLPSRTALSLLETRR